MNFSELKREFPIFGNKVHNNDLVYLDSANSSQKPKVVIDRIYDFYNKEFSNVGRSVHYLAVAATNLYENTRLSVQKYINAKDKNVIVIGGGDTGTDCIATSLRHGCKSLVNFELFPKPPDDRSQDNPWPLWPRIHRIDYGHAESEQRFGEDPRKFSISSKEILRNADGSLNGILTIEVDSKLQEIPGSEKKWDADLILLSMGFLQPEH